MQAAMMQPIWRFACLAVESVQMLENLFSVMFHDVYKTVCINLHMLENVAGVEHKAEQRLKIIVQI